ncbi:MAG: cobalt transporter [Cyanobacteria bacterium J007]|nr:MAG: cobalt transporter [Cyanobacteria bacterium J007]
MKLSVLFGSILAIGLWTIAPTVVFAHVGHGDEFQATGGVNRVPVNPDTDSLLGIEVSAIAPAPDGSAAVLIPVTALVDDNGRQLVFVQYEGFYEPVDVITGPTQGDAIEITEGLSIGEQLVTQGSLSLYAESRKTQTTDTATPPEAIASAEPNQTHAQADAQGIPHSHDASGNMVTASGEQGSETTTESATLPVGILAGIGGAALVVVGAIAFIGNSRKKNNLFSDK